ncbi:MAG: hypothetical protein II309_02000 [Bacilli bacterium]|nr:hypothetical protein [Bacilli bacterium]
MNLLNLAKDERDYLNDDVVLNIKDRKGIYQKRQENFKKQSLYDVSKESNNIDTEIYLDNLENESRKLDAETSVIGMRIENARNNTLLGKVNRALEMNDMINDIKKKDIPNIIKKAKKFCNSSKVLSIISALTTVIGVGIDRYNKSTNIFVFVLEQTFITIAVLYIAAKINDQIKTITCFADKFFEKKNIKKIVTLAGKIFFISAYTAFSIKTNVTFWSQFFGTAETWLFSILFDGLSIYTAIESDTYSNLDFNENYIDEINEALEGFERDENNDIENKQPKEPDYPFDNSNRKDDNSKNEKKNN